MATVFCYTPKNPDANQVVVDGLIVSQNPGLRSVGRPHPKLEKWVDKLVRVTILPNAAKTAEEQNREKLQNAALEALEQVEQGPPPEEHAKEPDLGNLDEPIMPTALDLETMDFKALKDYAKKVGLTPDAHSKKSYIKAIKDAGKVRSS